MFTVHYITQDMGIGFKECTSILEAELFEQQVLDLGYTTHIDPRELVSTIPSREKAILENIASIKEVALELLQREDALVDLANVLNDRCVDIEIALSCPNSTLELCDDSIDLDSVQAMIGA